MGGTLDPVLDEQLIRLVQGSEQARVIIWSRDGRAVFSSDPALRGRRFSTGEQLASAFAGNSVAEFGTEADDEADAIPGAADLPVPFLELYVPIRGSVDGNPIGVYEAYQDARGIEALVSETRSDVLILRMQVAPRLCVRIRRDLVHDADRSDARVLLRRRLT